MEHIAAASAAICMSASAHAQSSVTLYGSSSPSIAYVSNIAGNRSFRANSGEHRQDNFGFLGTEALGGGLQAIFRLEGAYFTQTGTQAVNGTLFNSEAYVGLKTHRGSVTLGRQTDYMYDYLSPVSNGVESQTYSNFHIGNLDHLGKGVQFNNAVKAEFEPVAGLTFGGLYGFGNVAGDMGQSSNLGAGIRYRYGPFQIAAAYANQHNVSLSTLTATIGIPRLLGQSIASATFDQESYGVGGTYSIGGWRLNALITGIHLTTISGSTSTNMHNVDVGLRYAFSPFHSVAVTYTRSTLLAFRWDQFGVADTYQLSKQTALYASIISQRAHGAGANAGILAAGGPSSSRLQTMVFAGIQHAF
ncbi:MAG: porin [Paraburkholderia sp.]|jgi:predicted porin|nr:porin [Paraburkholderia sp.]